MVTLPPLPTIPDTPPEPLTILTALFSLKGISNIFKDQQGFYKKFAPIKVSCPFAMLDDIEFKKDVYKFIAIEKQPTLKQLKVIHEWAARNMQFYEKNIQDKEFENPEPWEKYYTFNSDPVFGTGFSSANGFPMLEEIVRHPDNKQTREYPTLFWFYDFCKEVHKFTSDFLTEPTESNEAARQVATKQQPKQPKVKYYAAKWYALHHLICMASGKKVPHFESGSRKEIEQYAQNQYFKDRINGKGKEGFYRAWLNIDLNNLPARIKDFQKDRANWKEIITQISDNDADIVSWLSRQSK